MLRARTAAVVGENESRLRPRGAKTQLFLKLAAPMFFQHRDERGRQGDGPPREPGLRRLYVPVARGAPYDSLRNSKRPGLGIDVGPGQAQELARTASDVKREPK